MKQLLPVLMVFGVLLFGVKQGWSADLQKGVNKSYESIYYAVKNRCEKAPLDLVAEAIQWVVLNEL